VNRKEHSSSFKVISIGFVSIILSISLLYLIEKEDTSYKFELDEVVYSGDSVFTLDGHPLTGTIIDHYLVTNFLWTEEDYRNGVKHGITKVYFPSGKLQREIDFKNGLRDGFHITYFENGRKARIKSFRNGIAHGLEIHYYSDGSRWRIMNFENGEQVYFIR